MFAPSFNAKQGPQCCPPFRVNKVQKGLTAGRSTTEFSLCVNCKVSGVGTHLLPKLFHLALCTEEAWWCQNQGHGTAAFKNCFRSCICSYLVPWWCWEAGHQVPPCVVHATQTIPRPMKWTSAQGWRKLVHFGFSQFLIFSNLKFGALHFYSSLQLEKEASWKSIILVPKIYVCVQFCLIFFFSFAKQFPLL